LDEIVLEDERIDQSVSILDVLNGLGSGGNDEVVDSAVEVGAFGSAVAKVARAGSGGQSANSASRIGDAIKVDSGDGTVDNTGGVGGIVSDDNGDGLPLVLEENALSRGLETANNEVNLTKSIVRISDELEGNVVSARAVGVDASSEGTREDLDLKGDSIMAAQRGGRKGNGLKRTRAGDDLVVGGVVADKNVNRVASNAIGISRSHKKGNQ
jgi:hypothetical protein